MHSINVKQTNLAKYDPLSFCRASVLNGLKLGILSSQDPNKEKTEVLENDLEFVLNILNMSKNMNEKLTLRKCEIFKKMQTGKLLNEN